MPFICEDREDPEGVPTFYNVVAAVGYGCYNLVEDVKTVQFFLKRIYMNKDLKKRKPWGEMTVDGKVGPVTRAWIIQFQLFCNSEGGNTMVDGIVDTTSNDFSNWTSSISKTTYTIRDLNNVMRSVDGEIYKNLTTHPEVPQDMRLIFQQAQSLSFGKPLPS